MTLDELDQKLKENGCEQLYARNQTEATLVYAFLKGLSYEEWLDLQKICEEMNNEAKDQWFNGAGVTYRELREYVRANSDITEDELLTQKVTRRLRGQIEKTSTEEEFLRFMEDNREDFCVVREKARYYFCKYLCYYIEEKTEAYLAARKSGFGQEQALLELNVLKCVAVLRKNSKMTRKYGKQFWIVGFLLEIFMMPSIIFISNMCQRTGWRSLWTGIMVISAV